MVLRLKLLRSLKFDKAEGSSGVSSTEVGVENPGRQDFYAKHSDIAPPKGLP